MRGVLGAILVIGAVLLFLTIIVCTAMRLEAQWELPGAVAEIEQLRSDAEKVRFGESEDVVGQIAAWNQTIKRMQRYNNLWWADWLVPDGWDDVEIIRVKEAPAERERTGAWQGG